MLNYELIIQLKAERGGRRGNLEEYWDICSIKQIGRLVLSVEGLPSTPYPLTSACLYSAFIIHNLSHWQPHNKGCT